MASLKEQISAVNDNYLIEISNKGIFNRAQRELPDAGVKSALKDNVLDAVFGDGTTVSITDALTNFTCSCPSRTICKHVIMALLSVYDPSASAAIPKDAPVLPETSPKADKPAKPKIDTEIIPHVTGFIEEIYRIGLFRLPPEYSETCAQLATLCHGAGFASLERLFDTASKEFELYENKSSAFNELKLIQCLARIYQFCRAKDFAETAGTFKRQYEELPKLKLFGAGAYPWYAKSGFIGVTAIFYNPEFDRMFTFTNSRPAAVSKNNTPNDLKYVPWSIPASFDNLSKSEFVLYYPKISQDRRISSSESTSGSLVSPKPNISSMNCIDDFSAIKKLFDFKSGQISVYVILKINSLANDEFNEITQTYKAVITDKNGAAADIAIKYSPLNETSILNLEYLVKNNITPVAVTAAVSLSEESFTAEIFPVAVWFNSQNTEDPEQQNPSYEIKNIGFEKLFGISESAEGKKTKKESGYARFFK